MFMKKIVVLEEKELEELIKNANIAKAILHSVTSEKMDENKIHLQLQSALNAINVVNEILGK